MSRFSRWFRLYKVVKKYHLLESHRSLRIEGYDLMYKMENIYYKNSLWNTHDLSRFKLILSIKNWNINQKRFGSTLLHDLVRMKRMDYYGNSSFWEERIKEIEREYLSMIKHLLCSTRHIIDINQPDCYGRTALHIASKYLPKAVELILNYKHMRPDINLRDLEGRTALHFAARHQPEVVKTLVACEGIDANLKDNHDRTPLHLAIRHQPESIYYLLEKADISIRDGDGQTPHDLMKKHHRNGYSLC